MNMMFNETMLLIKTFCEQFQTISLAANGDSLKKVSNLILIPIV